MRKGVVPTKGRTREIDELVSLTYAPNGWGFGAEDRERHG